MSSRQHAPLVVVGGDGSSKPLASVPMQSGKAEGGYDEQWIRDLLFQHPAAIPVGEIDPAFGPLVPICKELDTRAAGFADALYVNHLGLPTLVECKLWRNPEARREVVGQILDYARVLRRWTHTDLQREAARARKEPGFDLFEHVRQRHPETDETAFVDAVTRNLTRGRILLLVIGDGIREGVEAIAEYVQDHAGLHFTLGLVEAPVFDLGDGRRIVQPRILAKTVIINRTVVDLISPEIQVVEAEAADEQEKPAEGECEVWMRAFWTDLVSTLKLDDAAQPMAKPTTLSSVVFMLPVPGGHMWITAYFSEKEKGIGVFLGMTKTSLLAMQIGERLMEEQEEIDRDIGLPTTWSRTSDGKVRVSSAKTFVPLRDPAKRDEQLAWFRQHVNAYVNALRPRVAALRAEIEQQDRP